MMTQKTSVNYPKTAMIVALAGGILVILSGALLMAVSAFILPHIDLSNVTPPQGLTMAGMQGLISGIVGAMGLFGLVSGVVVLASSILLIAVPKQRMTWSVLILVFSILSFFGLGGFVVGAILGIVGGVMALRWKAPVV